MRLCLILACERVCLYWLMRKVYSECILYANRLCRAFNFFSIIIMIFVVAAVVIYIARNWFVKLLYLNRALNA